MQIAAFYALRNTHVIKTVRRKEAGCIRGQEGSDHKSIGWTARRKCLPVFHFLTDL
jgi:hypothetical protein